MVVVASLVGVVILAFLASRVVSNKLRMPDHGWRAAVVVACVGIAGVIIASTKGEVKKGIDLNGGVILVYEVDEAQTMLNANQEGASEADIDMNALVSAISKRINPGGVSETVVRPYGDRQVEIIIPSVGEQDTELIKQKIVKGGFLRFMIVANRRQHASMIELAESAEQQGRRQIREKDSNGNPDGKIVGQWVPADYEEDEDGNITYNYEVRPNNITRIEQGKAEVLMYVDDNFPLEGGHLSSVRQGFENLSPCVYFNMKAQGARLMGGLTAANKPNDVEGIYSQLGIVMDNRLISAPNIKAVITDRGTISGNFTEENVEILVGVLQAGRLPAVLNETPISQSTVSPLLGKDTIASGKRAIVISLVAVLVFMLIYYRFAGIISSIALLLNLVMIFALMIFVGAAFSLAGFAGLVLTVGMSVDANVLIFERIREELRGGAALRMAIRNGFSRATPTIVDANLTNLITAIVLYVMGGDQLQGYAVPLILGIVMCMFTAIFVSRLVFEIAERQRWIKKLTMMQILSAPQFNLFAKRRIAAVFSAVLIVVGIGAALSRGTKIFDIDLNGGHSVTLELSESTGIGEIRTALADIADDVSITGIGDHEVRYKVDASRSEESSLAKIKEIIAEELSGKLKTYEVELVSAPTLVAAVAADASDSTPFNTATPSAEVSTPNDVLPDEDSNSDEDSTPTGPTDGDSSSLPRKSLDGELLAYTPFSPAMLLGQADDETTGSADADADAAADAAPAQRSQASLKFGTPLNAETLQTLLLESIDELGMGQPSLEFSNETWNGRGKMSFPDWTVTAGVGPDELTTILEHFTAKMKQAPVWLSEAEVGGKIAGDTTRSAIAAIVFSLLGIVGYIWIRFQRVSFGLAAVVALVHDVLITIGFIALSYWIVTAVPSLAGILRIDEFKISLPVVAAILTIIGYSLNDTIVVFDRIREVRGKSPEIREDMINTSINQTLSRTILTSTTTLIAVGILYAFGGSGIHPFSFALLVGVLVGTYSSIFIAAPALMWMAGERDVVENKPAEKVAV
ncbi:protein translocase subunit SecD [Planctomycetota bacterium]